MTDIKSLTPDELRTQLTGAGFPKFRAEQVGGWLQKGVTEFGQMKNISGELRQFLESRYYISVATIEKKLVSAYDNTVKYLFRLHDGAHIESVVMHYKYGYTVCVSSQVGCRMGCRFCASTLDGVVRNLVPAEILHQVYAAERDLGVRVSHVVLMGMGEPLDNYENVLRFLSLITDENGKNLSMRHISLSTCGIVPKIYALMELDLQLTLSVSLHAPTNEIRSAMMPVNKKWDLDALMEACRAYTARTSRRISFEYALVRGVNDSPACAEALCRRLRGMLCHINLIPVNEVRETGCRESTPASVQRFASILSGKGFAVTVRRKLGADINAACGQLRRSAEKKQETISPGIRGDNHRGAPG